MSRFFSFMLIFLSAGVLLFSFSVIVTVEGEKTKSINDLVRFNRDNSSEAFVIESKNKRFPKVTEDNKNVLCKKSGLRSLQKKMSPLGWEVLINDVSVLSQEFPDVIPINDCGTKYKVALYSVRMDKSGVKNTENSIIKNEWVSEEIL